MLLTVTSFSDQLVLQLLHLGGESLGQRPNRLVLRFLDQLPLVRDDLLDGLKKLELALDRSGRTAAGPTRGARPSCVAGPADRSGRQAARWKSLS